VLIYVVADATLSRHDPDRRQWPAVVATVAAALLAFALFALVAPAIFRRF
jgi:hypothetical protein